jgi:hypothetical protein
MKRVVEHEIKRMNAIENNETIVLANCFDQLSARRWQLLAADSSPARIFQLRPDQFEPDSQAKHKNIQTDHSRYPIRTNRYRSASSRRRETHSNIVFVALAVDPLPLCIRRAATVTE